ncbi:YjfB family protein [Clostridium sp. Marseille-P299]|uniref:YjfB family protein n=1 Tax=Clostridium sp. Marseille-P299 TaxID=1805477 RepID=UPI0009EDAFFA|nr:YjfB family protein [Clostridium sp. Marseille-P299]
MDIAALSMSLSQANLMQSVSTSVLSMNLDTVEESSDAMIKMMEQSVSPNLGQSVDIKL